MSVPALGNKKRKHKCQTLWPTEWLSLLLLLYRTAKNANVEKHKHKSFPQFV